MGISRTVSLALGLLCALPAAAADVDAGRERYVERCGRCHGMIEEKSARGPGGFLQPVVMLPLGPNLTGVIGRPAGQVPGYRYSDAFRAKAPGIVWDAKTLDVWLTDSRAMIPGTYMLVRIVPEERATIIGYLERYARAP